MDALTEQKFAENPFAEATYDHKIPESCLLVIFGATGDLTARKLLPALYNLEREGQLPAHFGCVGFARRKKDDEQFRKEMKEATKEYSRTKPLDSKMWERFSETLFYHQSEFDDDEGYKSLKVKLHQLDQKLDTRSNRLFYLSTPPKYFSMIIQKLKKHGLIYSPDEEKSFSRVIIEKPFGKDLQSAKELHRDISDHLSEEQTYRIDHYLGKETVQNLLVLRFANPFFEAVWNNRHIDHIQITMAEDIGIGTRGHFFEGAGILRDIVQNHMMQLLSLIAMEPPVNLDAKAIRDEKVKVLHSLRPFPENLDNVAVRGQYNKGYINGEEVKSYRKENDVDPNSCVETFAALKIFVDNWRWHGVPFYLRAGKRLPKRATEISIVFREVPGFLMKQNHIALNRNILVIRIQPDEGVSLKMNCKVPGLSQMIQPVKMDFKYGSFFGAKPPEAYERLICDCMAGDTTLFARIDEVLASWTLLDPLVHYWEQNNPSAFPNYASGSWGPNKADDLLLQDGKSWRFL